MGLWVIQVVYDRYDPYQPVANLCRDSVGFLRGWGWSRHESRIFTQSRPASFTHAADDPNFQTRAPGCALYRNSKSQESHQINRGQSKEDAGLYLKEILEALDPNDEITALRIVCSAALFVGDTPLCAANTKRLARVFPYLRSVSAICGSLHSEPSLQLPP